MRDINAAPPLGWASTSLEDIADIVRGIAFPKEAKGRSTDDGTIACLRTKNVQATVEWEDLWWIPKTYVRRPEQIVQDRDVLISVANSSELVGKVAMVNRPTVPATLGAFIALIRAKAPIEPRFLFYQLASPDIQQSIKRVASTTTNISNVNTSKVRAILLAVAPLNEQSRIGDMLDELLSDLDAGVAALERVRAKLKHYRTAVLKAAVEGVLTEEWRRKHPATETADGLLTRILTERRRRWEEAQRAKYEAAGRAPPRDWEQKYVEPMAADAKNPALLPDGWRWVTVDECIVSPVANGISVKGTDTPPGVAALRLSAMTETGFNYLQRRYLPLSPADVDDLWIRSGDFFVCRGNGSKKLVGRGTLAQDPKEDVIFPDTMMRLRVASILLHTRWISTIWSSSIVRRQIEHAAKTTAGIWKIAQPDLTRITIPLPPQAEQAAIVEAVEEQLSLIDHLERDLDTRLKSSQVLRQSILQQAFAGQLVPQDPSDEPASELLRRIDVAKGERARLARTAKQDKPKTKTLRRHAKKD